ncbi:GNAT family N-acetyltransferase [Streptomyces bambusae]|uniref:GNAT family N-acetyltransferase n=1 Tax=Streptomyces bambusae TaxID=1550616 RepID=UPI001CFEF49D|nr:GNAT family N-acetyltransferase [Streptomyces bambusae]MCB5163401.1 GNAT family N-acetyltransferase [Streptomyces bambusae]
MLFRPVVLAELDRIAAYPADGPVPLIGEERFRGDFAERQYRPEWSWVAEGDDGEWVARALWWGRADSTHPAALDCLHVSGAVADPAAVAAGLLEAGHGALKAAGATTLPLYNLLSLPGTWESDPATADAVSWRREAVRRAGLTREFERLQLAWTPAAPLPPEPTRLVFSEAEDEAFLDVFRRVAEGSLDVHTRGEVAAHGVETLAREDLEYYRDAPGERSWWRLAHLPDGTLAGFAIPSATPYARNVGYLGVLPELRGRGLIDDLLAWITRFHAEAGADRITATTDRVNAPMANAFARAGYETTEIRINFEPEPAASE